MALCTIPWDVMLYWQRKCRSREDWHSWEAGFMRFAKEAGKRIDVLRTQEGQDFEAWSKALRAQNEREKDMGAGI